MDNRSQGHYSCPIPNPMESGASNMYFLQVKPNNSEGSLEADAIPLHMLINEQDPQNEHIFIPVLQGKQLQLFIDSRGQASTSMNPINNQYYTIPSELQIKPELQVLNNGSSITASQRNLVEELESVALPSSVEIKISDVKVSCNDEQKKSVQRFVHMSDRRVEPRATASLPGALRPRRGGVAPRRPLPQRVRFGPVQVHMSDRRVEPRATASLPGALRPRRGGVAPRRPLPQRVRFGPVQGIRRDLSTEEAESLKLECTSSRVPVFLLKNEEGSVTHIDVSDKDKSNWLSLLPLGDESTANVWLYQEDHQLFAATTRTIPARAPLLLGYSKEYVDVHKLPVTEPVLDLDAELSAKHRQWWCHECQRSMSTAALLQRHMDVYHLEEKPKPRRYRCLHCTRSFCRLFTLRRHVAENCTKKLKEEKIDEPQPQTANEILEPSKPDELPDLSINTTDDSRLPSDESLQTLAHSLDFPTTLFDTERLPSLDMSGSRSETDDSYSLGLKDDVYFGVDVCSKKEVKTENAETVFLTCRYCNQAVVRGRQRQHVKSCAGRKFRCECGRAFQYRDKLALHVHAEHAHSAADPRAQNAKEDELQYKCETCNHKFKRRGMLVNHLWRVHKTSTAVPLEKRVRHYPCGACPKVYRAAAKRDRHVKTHHPGQSVRGMYVEGARVACAAAACAACPRQYATRAKLLQHVRRSHPALAPPLKS